MSTNTLEELLVYATIPVYVAGLLVLVYFIARYQLQLSLTREIKRVLKSSVKNRQNSKRLAYPPVVYLSVGLLFILLTAMAILLEKGKRS
jgi:hypothetical protein